MQNDNGLKQSNSEQTGLANLAQRCVAASHEGTLSFPEIVAQLAAGGVERYAVDFVAGESVYYGPGSSWVCVSSPSGVAVIADQFDAAAVRAAVLDSQLHGQKYPDFVRRVQAVGCTGYTVFLGGRHVVYYGRRGETHVERFPDAA